jgi:CHAT domain-containing protein
VLSACDTQLGKLSKGDDLVGLNRAFIYAGTPTVVASLWSVDDESTSLLMRSFYTHLKQGMSKAKALQAAQAETRKKYPHPYYWAGFVLTGDPGRSETSSPTVR